MNRALAVVTRWLLVLGSVVLSLSIGSCSQSQLPISIATELKIQSKVLKEERVIAVSLPEGYEQTEAGYPVLYLLDGMQNLRHVVGSSEILTRTGNLPPLIIVAIKSVERMRDFTPSKVQEVEMSGGGTRFLDFLQNELVPYIEARYRTHPYRILEGHSMGGLFAAYAFLESPQLFDAYILMSPALWWNEEELSSRVGSFLKANATLDKSIYFGIGTEDGYGMRQELKAFASAIEESAPEGLRWEHREFEGEGHMSAPLLINYRALKFIFAETRLPEQLWTTFSDAAFLGHENRMMERFGRAARQSQEVYVSLALKLMEENNYEGAVTVFKRNAQAYESNDYPPNYAWLADAYEKNGDAEEALEAYEMAYSLSVKTGYGDKDRYHSKIERLRQSLDKPGSD